MKESSRMASSAVVVASSSCGEDDSVSLSSTFTNTDGMPTLKPYHAVVDSSDDDDNNNNRNGVEAISSGRSSSLNNNGRVNNRKVKGKSGNDSSSEDSDDGDNFSVKTHLDSVTSLPKKRRQRRNRSNASTSSHSSSRDLHLPSRSRKVQFDTSSSSFHESREYLEEDDDQEEEANAAGTLCGVTDSEENALYDVSARWYCPQDYKHFKLNVLLIAKAVFKAQRHRAQNVEQDNFSYSGPFETEYDACFQKGLEVPKCNILSKQEQREFQGIY